LVVKPSASVLPDGNESTTISVELPFQATHDEVTLSQASSVPPAAAP